MSTKLFVGNLSFNATQEQLQDLFAAHGTVVEVDVIKDKFSGRPRGFAFVSMETKEAADAAVQALNIIVTVNLSKGALAMARKKVIVKRLNAIQNFGAMDVLCTDKTGTLTQGKI